MRARSGFHFGRGEWWAVASAVTFASANVLTRIVSVGGDPLAGSIIRTTPQILFCFLMMGWRYKEIAHLLPQREEFLGWRTMTFLAISSVIIVPVGIVALYLAFRYGGILVAVTILSINPLWGALIAVPFLGEVFNRQIGIGIITSIVGIALLTYGQYVGAPVSPLWPLGVVFALITAFSWALTANLRRYFLSEDLDIFLMIGINSSVAVGVLIVILIGLGRIYTLFEFSLTQIWQLLVSGGLSAAGNFTLTAALALATVASVTTLKSLDIVITSLIAVLFLGEILNLPIVMGIILIVGGVFIVQAGKMVPTSVAI